MISFRAALRCILNTAYRILNAAHFLPNEKSLSVSFCRDRKKENYVSCFSNGIKFGNFISVYLKFNM